ncbi:hypothetical protein LCGC14_1947440, partial [marine sediment metagenome]
MVRYVVGSYLVILTLIGGAEIMTTKIEWTQETWNPVTGCTKVSPGCENCYALHMAYRLQFMHKADARYEGLTWYNDAKELAWTGKVNCCPDTLKKPLHWRKPHRIFVCSMSDLFHEDVPEAFIAKAWDVMWATPWHTYQILTKRIERLRKFARKYAYLRHDGGACMKPGDFLGADQLEAGDCGWGKDWQCSHPDNIGDCNTYTECPIAYEVRHRDDLAEIGVADDYEYDDDGVTDDNTNWMELHTRPREAMARNVWLGVTVENKDYTDRIDYLRRTPAAVKFLSLEPLLGPLEG